MPLIARGMPQASRLQAARLWEVGVMDGGVRAHDDVNGSRVGADPSSQFAELAVVVTTPNGRVVADLSYLGRPYRFKLGLPPGRYLARSLNNPAVVTNVRSGTTTRVVLPQSCG